MLSPSRYLAWLYSPEAQQPVLAKLREIEGEIASSLRPGVDHHVAHARLQWWQEECERCAQGRPVHPLTRELVKSFGALAAAGQPSPLAGLSGFVDTAVWDLASATFDTRKELTEYCERWAAAMFETAAAWVVAGATPPPSVAASGVPPPHGTAASGVIPASTAAASGAQATESLHVAPAKVTIPSAANGGLQLEEAAHATRAIEAARMMGTSDSSGGSVAVTSPARAVSRWRALGAAVREVELLADLAREAHLGRVRVPLDELERAGVEVSSLAKPPWPASLATLLRERHEALREIIGESVAALGREEQAGYRGLLVWAALAWRQSVRAQRALPGIISPRRYHALADGWQAWRAARRAAAGKLRLS